jgi:hypothetical protein
MDHMTKEQLIKAIHEYGCGLLNHLPLELMTKEQIINHLEECNCPKLQELKKPVKN